jgi:hypothetical protein
MKMENAILNSEQDEVQAGSVLISSGEVQS